MLYVFIGFALSLQNCTAGINHYYMSADIVSLKANEWYYFYSEAFEHGDDLVVRVHPKDSEVIVANGEKLMCPSESDPHTTAPAGKTTLHKVSAGGNLALQIFGIHTTSNTDCVISVMGNNPNNQDVGVWKVLSGVFLAFCILLLVLLFVHSILARGRVHYQVNVEE